MWLCKTGDGVPAIRGFDFCKAHRCEIPFCKKQRAHKSRYHTVAAMPKPRRDVERGVTGP